MTEGLYKFSYEQEEKFEKLGLKYIFSDETIEVDGHILYRIIATRDLELCNGKKIKKGQMGGFVETTENLSHYGQCWIYDNAKVYGSANVYHNAIVYGNARVRGKAEARPQ